MKRALKWVLWTVGGIVMAFIALIAVVMIFVEDGSTGPVATFSVNDKKVLVFTPGSGQLTHTTTSSASEGQIIVRNRKIALRRDGSVLVDDKALDLGKFSILEVYVHPDQRVETRITRSGG